MACCVPSRKRSVLIEESVVSQKFNVIFVIIITQ